MTTVDLGRFSTQILSVEQANIRDEQASRKAAPLHPHRQPVHVVYGGAHMFNVTTIKKLGDLALAAFEQLVSDSSALAEILGEPWDREFADELYKRVHHKLSTYPIEDYRIDFEDGYGVRPDHEEDQHAKSAAHALAEMVRNTPLGSQIGIRVKPFSSACLRRSIRTLVTFVETFCNAAPRGGALHRLIVTLPKVSSADQVRGFVEILEQLEIERDLPPHYFSVELLIETPDAFLSTNGRIPLPSFLEAAKGRCTSLHFGVYDFTSSLGIGSAGQAIDHGTCEFARHWMQTAAGLFPGIAVSDGIISTLPIPIHRGAELTDAQKSENKTELQTAWRYNYRMMTKSLMNGLYQGWDLHPSQVPIRHIANHVYVLKELPAATKRMQGFIERSAQANRVGSVFDDRASVLGLINFAERGIASKILTDEDFTSAGVDLARLKAMI